MTGPDVERVRPTARAVGTLYLYRAVTGFIVAYPVAKTLGAFGATSRPDGDLVLFAASGTYLLESIRLGARAIPASLESGSVIALAFALGGLVPLALALADLLNPGSSRTERWSVVADRTPTLFFLCGATLLLQGVVAIVTGLAMTAISSLTDSLRNEEVADVIPLLFGTVGLGLIGAIGILQDLARAAAMRHGTHGIESARIAGRTAISAPRAVLSAFVGPILATVVVVFAAGAVTSALDVSRPGAFRVACVCFEHQLAVVAVVVLRLVALGNALALVGRQAPGRRSPEDSPRGSVFTG